jgi:hypothetical protein
MNGKSLFFVIGTASAPVRRPGSLAESPLFFVIPDVPGFREPAGIR